MPWHLRKDYQLEADGEIIERTSYVKALHFGRSQTTANPAEAMTFVSEATARQYASSRLRGRGYEPARVAVPARDFEASVNGRFGQIRARANG